MEYGDAVTWAYSNHTIGKAFVNKITFQ
jgi:hypothetical protein